MKDIGKKLFWQFVLLLIIIRVFLVVFVMLGIPDLGNVQYNGLYPYLTTGDEPYYFEKALSFMDGEFTNIRSYTSIGTSLYIIPFIVISGADTTTDIFKIVSFFQVFILYSLSIVFVSYIALSVLKDKILAIISTVLYLVFPYFLYVLNIGPYEYNYNNYLDAMWFRPVMSDAPSAFFVYLGIFLFFWFLKKASDYKRLIYSALSLGFAALIRVPNVLVCVIIGFYFLLKRKHKEFLLFLIFSLVVFVPQLVFNLFNNGSIIDFTNYVSEEEVDRDEYYNYRIMPGRISARGITIDNYFYLLSVADKYIPALSFVLFILLLASVFTFYHLYKKNKFGAVFVFLWILLFGLLYGAFDSAARNIRYWLPIIPAVLIMVVVFFDMLVKGSIILINKFKKYEQA